MTNTDNYQVIAGVSGCIGIGCVAENTPKYLSQALRLAQSVRWFGCTMTDVNFIGDLLVRLILLLTVSILANLETFWCDIIALFPYNKKVNSNLQRARYVKRFNGPGSNKYTVLHLIFGPSIRS